jgi:hypothetical protein
MGAAIWPLCLVGTYLKCAKAAVNDRSTETTDHSSNPENATLMDTFSHVPGF